MDETEFLGVDSESYEIYEDVKNLDAKFRKIAPRILELKPKDVKKVGISKQTLWNMKYNIRNNRVDKISTRIKKQVIHFFDQIITK